MKNIVSTQRMWNVIFGFFLIITIIFSVVRIVNAVAPNPGHTWSEIGDVLVSVVNGGTGAAPGAGDQVLISDSTSAATWKTITDCTGAGKALQYAQSSNTWGCNNIPVYSQSVSTASGFSSDTYLTGSSITIPSNSLQIGSRYHLLFEASKTAAGTAAPVLTVRFGTNGTTADTARCTLTFSAQTAATDTGTFEVWVTFRTVGSGTSAVMQCVGQRRHGASVTGFGTLVSQTVPVTSGGFDSTVANSKIGVSVNGGTSAAWTVTLVQSKMENLN